MSGTLLLHVELVLANIARHPCGYQTVQRQPLVATLADLSSRDIIEVFRKCTAVDTLLIGDKKWVVWEMKWPFAITNNQLKGSKHLAQRRFSIIILPGENALGGITSGQKKHVGLGRIHPQ